MQTFSRRGAAKKLGVSMNHLLYWEKKDKLNPQKIKAGDNTLVIYTPSLIKRAEEILNRKKNKKEAVL